MQADKVGAKIVLYDAKESWRRRTEGGLAMWWRPSKKQATKKRPKRRRKAPALTIS